MMVGELAYLGQQAPGLKHKLPGARMSCYNDEIYGTVCQEDVVFGIADGSGLMGLPPSNHMVHTFSPQSISGLPPSNHTVHTFSDEMMGLGDGLFSTFGLGQETVPAPATTPAPAAPPTAPATAPAPRAPEVKDHPRMYNVGGALTMGAVGYLLYRSGSKEGSKNWKTAEYIAAGLFGAGAVFSVLRGFGILGAKK